jgi:hypothetical protein
VIGKLKRVLSNDGALFTISNLIFSFSTYLIALIIPYKFDIKAMADFSATLNIVLIFAFVFEFGLATSYLRFNQLYKITGYVNAYFQMGIFLLLIIAYSTPLGDYLGDLMGVENIELHQGILYFSIFSILSWMFFKNIYLSNKKVKFIFFNAIILLLVRVGFLSYIFLKDNIPTMNEVFLYLFIFPFVIVAMFNMKNNISFLYRSFEKMKDMRNINIFLSRFKTLLIFSAFTYVIGVLYIYTSRYVLVYLTEHNLTVLLAELGYAFSFGGLITVFLVSVRLYFISKYNISDKAAIALYVDKIKRYKYHSFLAIFLIASAISYIVYMIKPDYLSIRSIYFLFMIIASYGFIMYFSLITLLAKAYNFNKIELMLNIIRLVLVVIVVHLLIKSYPIIGFALFSGSMVLIEFIFAKIVLSKILKKEIT